MLTVSLAAMRSSISSVQSDVTTLCGNHSAHYCNSTDAVSIVKGYWSLTLNQFNPRPIYMFASDDQPQTAVASGSRRIDFGRAAG